MKTEKELQGRLDFAKKEFQRVSEILTDLKNLLAPYTDEDGNVHDWWNNADAISFYIHEIELIEWALKQQKQ